jgi:hypothetical protein
MFVGAKFKATVNRKGFNQSQLLVMCEIPNRDTIRGKLQIKLFAAPLGVSHFDTRNGHMDQGDMIANGWKPVKVGITPESGEEPHITWCHFKSETIFSAACWSGYYK